MTEPERRRRPQLDRGADSAADRSRGAGATSGGFSAAGRRHRSDRQPSNRQRSDRQRSDRDRSDRARDDRARDDRAREGRPREDRPRRDDRARGDRFSDSRPRRDGRARFDGSEERGRFDERRPRGGRRDGELSREEVREQERAVRPGLERKANEPAVPDEHDPKTLPRQVRAELRGLPQDLALIVGAHLQAAGELIDSDPELALAHAHAARRRAARLPIVREATAEVAYAAGDWTTALTEYRAMHRMTGSAEYLPVLADCERALGRPREALALARQAATVGLPADAWLEMVMVEAGARHDLGQPDEGIRVLRQAISTRRGTRATQARLRFALADLCEQIGEVAQAIEAFQQAEQLDVDGELPTDERLVALGVGALRTPRVDDDIEVVEFGDNEPEEQPRVHERSDS